MSEARKASARPALRRLRRGLLMAAIVLGGTGYVFRHSLFPSGQPAELPAPAEAPMAVTVVVAQPGPISRRIVAAGTLVPREEVLIPAEVIGVRIEQVLVDVGASVTEGQLLAVLDSQRLDLLLAQKAADRTRAEAATAQAEALAAEADADAAEAGVALRRALALQAKGTISAQLLGERETAATTTAARARAQVQSLAAARAEQARVMAERAELLWQLGQIELRATASGIVTGRDAKAGQTTAADGAPLFRIMKDGEVEMDARVIETALTAIHPGQDVTVRVAGEDRPVAGRVRLVSPALDPVTRTGQVWISLKGEGLKPGSFALASFETDRREAIVLPHAAVLAGSAGPQVQVVRDGVITVRPVTTGLMTATGVEIVSGLAPGEVVVAMAGGFLRDGSPVTPVAPDPATGAGDR